MSKGTVWLWVSNPSYLKAFSPQSSERLCSQTFWTPGVFITVVWLPPIANIHLALIMCGARSGYLHVIDLTYCSNNLNRWQFLCLVYIGGQSRHSNCGHFAPKPSQQRGPPHENSEAAQGKGGKGEGGGTRRKRKRRHSSVSCPETD